MDINKQSPYHLFCFVYLGFAQLSNEEINEKVIEEIERKVAIWMNVNANNIIEFNHILTETYNFYNNLREDERLNKVMEIASQIKNIEGFNLENRKTFLSDIRDIAVADGRFNTKEKQMHDKIGKELGINIMTTDKKVQKKLGY